MSFIPLTFISPPSAPAPRRGRAAVSQRCASFEGCLQAEEERDNGINETVAHNTNLANQFPDRSLQWIDIDTGAPQGTALMISYPAGTVGDDNHLNMAFGVDEAGVLNVGVADTIRRCASKRRFFNLLYRRIEFGKTWCNTEPL